jgi:hypothetical protein
MRKIITLLLLGICLLGTSAHAVVTEYIRIGINQAYVTKHPELTDGVLVGQLIADLNAALATTTNKRYALAPNGLFVYADASIGTHSPYTSDTLTGNVANYYDNGWTKYIGTTIWFWGWTGPSYYTFAQSPALSPIVEGSTNTWWSGSRTFTSVSILFWEPQDYYFINRNDGSRYANPCQLLNKDRALALVLHELGHTHGLGNPEEYLLDFVDSSGGVGYLEPTVPVSVYSWKTNHKNDPMALADPYTYDKCSNTFNAFNSWLIDWNAQHQYYWGIGSLRSAITGMQVELRVYDVHNHNSLDVSLVDVYVRPGVGADGTLWNMSYFGHTIPPWMVWEGGEYVDIGGSGRATININDLHLTDYVNIWGVKVVYDTVHYGAGIISVQDLLDTKLRQCKNKMVLPIYVDYHQP